MMMATNLSCLRADESGEADTAARHRLQVLRAKTPGADDRRRV